MAPQTGVSLLFLTKQPLLHPAEMGRVFLKAGEKVSCWSYRGKRSPCTNEKITITKKFIISR